MASAVYEDYYRCNENYLYYLFDFYERILH